MRVHPIFYVSLLEPVATDPLPGQINPPPPPVIVDDQEEYFVEEILDVKPNGIKPYYVKWLGYSEPTWEPFSTVKDLAALDTFYARYPSKPRPRS
jgi:hypothetical protein